MDEERSGSEEEQPQAITNLVATPTITASVKRPSPPQAPLPNRPFWNSYTAEKSSDLWLPTVSSTGEKNPNSQQGLGGSKSMAQSWFTTKLLTWDEQIEQKEEQERLKKLSSVIAASLLHNATEVSQDPSSSQNAKVSNPRKPAAGKAKVSNPRKPAAGKANDSKPKKPAAGKAKVAKPKKAAAGKVTVSMPEKPAAGKAKKIKLKLTTEQKRVLNQWFGTARWTYNQILAAKIRREVDWVTSEDRKAIRERFLNRENYDGKENEWVLDTPYDIRHEAMRDLIKAYESNEAIKEKNPDHDYTIKMKSKKAATDSIVIHSTHYDNFGRIYPDTMKKA